VEVLRCCSLVGDSATIYEDHIYIFMRINLVVSWVWFELILWFLRLGLITRFELLFSMISWVWFDVGVKVVGFFLFFFFHINQMSKNIFQNIFRNKIKHLKIFCFLEKFSPKNILQKKIILCQNKHKLRLQLMFFVKIMQHSKNIIVLHFHTWMVNWESHCKFN